MKTEAIKNLTEAGLRKHIAALEAENAVLREALEDSNGVLANIRGELWEQAEAQVRDNEAALATAPSGKVAVDRVDLVVMLADFGGASAPWNPFGSSAYCRLAAPLKEGDAT